MRRLSRSARVLLEKLQSAIALAEKSGNKKSKIEAEKLKQELYEFLEPKKSKFISLKKPKLRKKGPKTKIKFRKGTDPRVIAGRRNGQRGGNKTAATHSREEREAWGSKAGNSTLQKYGRDFFKFIRSKRKNYPKSSRSARVSVDHRNKTCEIKVKK